MKHACPICLLEHEGEDRTIRVPDGSLPPPKGYQPTDPNTGTYYAEGRIRFCVNGIEVSQEEFAKIKKT